MGPSAGILQAAQTAGIEACAQLGGAPTETAMALQLCDAETLQGELVPAGGCLAELAPAHCSWQAQPPSDIATLPKVSALPFNAGKPGMKRLLSVSAALLSKSAACMFSCCAAPPAVLSNGSSVALQLLTAAQRCRCRHRPYAPVAYSRRDCCLRCACGAGSTVRPQAPPSLGESCCMPMLWDLPQNQSFFWTAPEAMSAMVAASANASDAQKQPWLHDLQLRRSTAAPA